MATGKVKFFNLKKGFGFIIDDNTQNDIFVHATGLIDRDIHANDDVNFDLEITNAGNRQQAINVMKNES
jgi:CspA family cold shock protein